jgi:aldehyde:ferredoxin oxidoreductase
MLRLVTGWDVTAGELRQTAARIVAAKRLFNERAGWSPAEDTLPARLLARPLDDDPEARLTAEQLAAAVREYNLARGLTAEGRLDAVGLAALEIGDLAGSVAGVPNH